MEWDEFKGWLRVLKRRREGPELSPDSWAGYGQNGWYQEQRRKRDEERAARFR